LTLEEAMQKDSHYQIVVVGGGTAGLTVAARLCRALRSPSLAVIEPSDKHFYQPLWTLVGAGVFPKEVSMRPEADYIPRGAAWLRDTVSEFLPEENCVRISGGNAVGYDFLVVAPGIQVN
jgi:sulfide:quinone oxidoreductase